MNKQIDIDKLHKELSLNLITVLDDIGNGYWVRDLENDIEFISSSFW